MLQTYLPRLREHLVLLDGDLLELLFALRPHRNDALVLPLHTVVSLIESVKLLREHHLLASVRDVVGLLVKLFHLVSVLLVGALVEYPRLQPLVRVQRLHGDHIWERGTALLVDFSARLADLFVGVVVELPVQLPHHVDPRLHPEQSVVVREDVAGELLDALIVAGAVFVFVVGVSCSLGWRLRRRISTADQASVWSVKSRELGFETVGLDPRHVDWDDAVLGLHVFRIIPQELAQDLLLLACGVYFLGEEVAVRHTLRTIQITLLITPI